MNAPATPDSHKPNQQMVVDAAAIAPLRAHWEAQGRGDFSPLWSGQNASGCRAAPAADITRALARGFQPA